MKIKYKIFSLFATCFFGSCYADTVKSETVPKSFFGISLGDVVDYDLIKKTPNLTEKIIRIDIDSGGLVVYVQPNSENLMFPFVISNDINDKQRDAASHLVYLTPIQPKFKIRPDQLKQVDLFTYEISEIKWSDISKERNFIPEKSDYFWARNLCDAIKIKIQINPKINNNEKLNIYSCNFEQSGRSFEIHSITGRAMKLAYSEDIMNKKYSDLKKYAQDIIGDAVLNK